MGLKASLSGYFASRTVVSNFFLSLGLEFGNRILAKSLMIYHSILSLIFGCS